MAELKFYGAGSFEIKTKDTNVIIDPYAVGYASKQPVTKGKVVILTQETGADVSESSFVINSPGEYEISKVSVQGIVAVLNTDDGSGSSTGIIYRLTLGDVTFGIIGNINPNLTDDQLEDLGVVDYLIIAAGGHGLSLEPTDAARLVAAIEPKVVLASHFADSAINYPVPQEEVAVFAKELGLEPKVLPKLKLSRSNLPEDMELVVLEKTN